MKHEQTYQEIEKALNSFRIAEKEFNRPNEDSVTYCTCHYSRKSIDDFLVAFLFNHSIKVVSGLPTDKLLSECQKLDPGFKAIDMSCFVCKNELESSEKSYCLAIDKVDECFTVSRQVKDLVMSALNIKEKDFERAN